MKSRWSVAWLWLMSNRRSIGLALSAVAVAARGSLLLADKTVFIDTLENLSALLLIGGVATAAAGGSKSDSFYRETMSRADVGLPERRGGSRQREAIKDLKAVSAAPVLEVVAAVQELQAQPAPPEPDVPPRPPRGDDPGRRTRDKRRTKKSGHGS